jgi:hypothetical protein
VLDVVEAWSGFPRITVLDLPGDAGDVLPRWRLLPAHVAALRWRDVTLRRERNTTRVEVVASDAAHAIIALEAIAEHLRGHVATATATAPQLDRDTIAALSWRLRAPIATAEPTVRTGLVELTSRRR